MLYVIKNVYEWHIYKHNKFSCIQPKYLSGPKSAKKNKGHVFISYSWNEKEVIMKLRERLKVSSQDFLCPLSLSWITVLFKTIFICIFIINQVTLTMQNKFIFKSSNWYNCQLQVFVESESSICQCFSFLYCIDSSQHDFSS